MAHERIAGLSPGMSPDHQPLDRQGALRSGLVEKGQRLGGLPVVAQDGKQDRRRTVSLGSAACPDARQTRRLGVAPQVAMSPRGGGQGMVRPAARIEVAAAFEGRHRLVRTQVH